MPIRCVYVTSETRVILGWMKQAGQKYGKVANGVDKQLYYCPFFDAVLCMLWGLVASSTCIELLQGTRFHHHDHLHHLGLDSSTTLLDSEGTKRKERCLSLCIDHYSLSHWHIKDKTIHSPPPPFSIFNHSFHLTSTSLLDHLVISTIHTRVQLPGQWWTLGSTVNTTLEVTWKSINNYPARPRIHRFDENTISLNYPFLNSPLDHRHLRQHRSLPPCALLASTSTAPSPS